MKWIASDGRKFGSIVKGRAYEDYISKSPIISKKDKLSRNLNIPIKTKPLKQPKIKVVKPNPIIKIRKRKHPQYDKYATYLLRAIEKNRSFDFTCDEFNALISLDCEYCGASNANTLDRIDSNLGYTWDNVKSACWTCNRMKYIHSIEEFYTHIQKILDFRDKS